MAVTVGESLPSLSAAGVLPAVASATLSEWTAIHGEDREAPTFGTLEAGVRIGGAGLPADSLALLRLASAVGGQFALADEGIDDYLLRRRSLGEWAALAAHALSRPDAAVRFSTSGSTGEPRACRHEMGTLWQEARWLAGNLPPFERIYTVAPAHHIYGFIFGVLLPAAADVPVVHAAGVDQWRPDRIKEGDLVVGFPTFWQYLVSLGRRLPVSAVGTSSTAPLPASVAEAVAGNDAGSLIEVFGSSETAGLGIRATSGGEFRLMDHWRRGRDGRLQRRRPDGQWQTHEGPDDTLEWTDEHHFRPAGRRDGAVQIGGTNVYPADVARRLCAHPDVNDCHVRTGPGGSDARLKAFVVPRDTADPMTLPAELRQWCERQFRPAERPVSFTLGPALPRNAMGKLQDW
ncbi:AMP-binding protein [Ectothiorhodospiraceae bacterium WFHF3C12]|nr:AMP-binding protein [Ectothiorhodospiraceae bacterium WFHF3C12]